MKNKISDKQISDKQISDKQISDKQKARQIILTSFLFIFSAVFPEESNLHFPKNLFCFSEESILKISEESNLQTFSAGIYSASSDFFLRIARLRFGFSSAAGVSSLTPANSGSIRIRPQYSQGIIFLCILMSNWR